MPQISEVLVIHPCYPPDIVVFRADGAVSFLGDYLALDHISPLNINEGQSHWFEASKAQNIDKWERVYGKAVAKGL